MGFKFFRAFFHFFFISNVVVVVKLIEKTTTLPQAVDCGVPPNIPYGILAETEAPFNIYRRLHVVCYTGYVASGPLPLNNFVDCDWNGHWTPIEVSCLPDSCTSNPRQPHCRRYPDVKNSQPTIATGIDPILLCFLITSVVLLALGMATFMTLFFLPYCIEYSYL